MELKTTTQQLKHQGAVAAIRVFPPRSDLVTTIALSVWAFPYGPRANRSFQAHVHPIISNIALDNKIKINGGSGLLADCTYSK